MATHDHDNRPHLVVTIGSVKSSVLVDTGAKLTCISEKHLETVQRVNKVEYKKTSTTAVLVGADKSLLQCAGVAHIPLTFAQTTVTWPAHIVTNLQPEMLLGMDILAHLGAKVDTVKGQVWFTQADRKIQLIAAQNCFVEPTATATVRVTARCSVTGAPVTATTGIALCLLDTLLEGIVTTDSSGKTTVVLVNGLGEPRHVEKGEEVGQLEVIHAPEEKWLSEDQAWQAIAPVQTPEVAPQTAAPDPIELQKKKDKLIQCLNICCPPEFTARYQQLFLEFVDVFSLDDNDLGFSNLFEHRIDLTSNNPVHVKQFRIPMAQHDFVVNRVQELRKLRCVEPSTSPYNTPIFAVPKKTLPGEPPKFRLIQDLRKLNEITKVDKHSICDVRTCLDKIGELNAAVFSSIDLRAGYHQMGLAKESRPLTAFTLPGVGQFQWRVTTMGLTGAPASFSKLMEKVMAGLHFILRYLDDLLAASRSHEEHLHHLRQALARLRQFGLKINPEKSTFAAESVEYLGHTVTKDGFTVGEHKFHAIKDFPTPSTKKKVQQFLGLANFFRQLIPGFQKHAGFLSALTRKEDPWKGGELPPKALLAFRTLRNALLTKPVVTFPIPNQPFTLATDAAVGDSETPGGLGAVLTQAVDGHDRVIAYASRALKQHEKSQSAFQLELQAVIWALNHFGPYLRHTTFTVVTDHRPVANLSRQQLRSLHRLHQKMLEFPCVIQYRPGVLNDIADALSRNPVMQVTNIDCAIPNIEELQATDRLCMNIIKVMKGDKQAVKENPTLATEANRFTLLHGLLAFADATGAFDGHRIVVPRAARVSVLKAAHDHPLAGHRGEEKTLQAVQARYWWPSMTQQVRMYVKYCATCQKSKNPANFSMKAPLFPLPPPQQPNDRVHTDLFGPLVKSENGNCYILTMTCAFSKFVRVVPIPDKRAETVAAAILGHWIAVFGPMKRLVHDQGKEFHNKLLHELLTWLGIEQRATSAMAPSVNGEAEIFNKWIASYLKTMRTKTKEDWEGHLAPLNLAYNSAVHSAHKRQPGAVMFGRRLALPHLDPKIPPDNVPWTQKQKHLMLETWEQTRTQLSRAGDKMMQQQQQTKSFIPLQGERVLVFYPRTALAAQGMPKLQQQWKEGVILAQLTPATFLVRLRFSKQAASMIHANRLKPFLPRIILPAEQWCVDPKPVQQQQNAVQRAVGKLACPKTCPCKKKKKKKGWRKNQAGEWTWFSGEEESDEEEKFAHVGGEQQQQQDVALPPEPAPPPPPAKDLSRTPVTPSPSRLQRLREAWHRSQARRRGEDSTSSDQDIFQTPPTEVTDTPRSTRAHPQPFPQPVSPAKASRALLRLHTALARFRNPVPARQQQAQDQQPEPQQCEQDWQADGEDHQDAETQVSFSSSEEEDDHGDAVQDGAGHG